MSGSEVSGTELAEVLLRGHLRFGSIDRIRFRVRTYKDVAIITGHTLMAGAYDGKQFRINSAYTHVFIKDFESWRMVSAQGTPMTSTTRNDSK
jgi:ketosteroid isomerase-like protein